MLAINNALTTAKQLILPLTNVKHTFKSQINKLEGSEEREGKVRSMKLFSKTGCYSEVHNTLRLVLVIFNSNLVAEGNEAALEDDPLGIWSWLRMELLKAREKDLKVYLIMSVPPGVFESGLAIPGIHWFHQKHNRKYIVMVREFRDIIMGQFAGHHHTDTFRVFYNKNEFPVSWLLLAPSVAPNCVKTAAEICIYTNPGARLYKYDKETLEVPANEALY
ncbi:acid sphingomyelinase-like phosphodiesterase 3b [Schistocerca piceifrons]|uniref:acid sphingomyelinase-like phosphodiesterase 3b n=1 Tax=Schistocerca piceifrons TaxID=274613 RepID=UPI001F5F973D|nr:acid sphingomyelinase-like phosphodiesterase 3b [Schistocerca piceifrons]